MEGGRTNPWLGIASGDDGEKHPVVIKLRTPKLGQIVNDQGHAGHYLGTSLACELICSLLARHLGLSAPRCFVVRIGNELVSALPSEKLRDLFGANLGDNFGSLHLKSLTQWRPEATISSSLLLDQAEDLLAFDVAVVNGDRQRSKPNLLYRGSTVYPIDHSLALPCHVWPQRQIAESPMLPDGIVQKHCCFKQLKGRSRPFQRLFANWQDQLNSESFEHIRSMLPDSWERRDGDLDRIFQFLESRAEHFGRLRFKLTRIVK